jgi:hypothetical protein
MKELILFLLLLCLLLFPERRERFESLREYSDVVREVQQQLDLQGTDVIQVEVKSKDELSFHVVDRATLKGYLLDFSKGKLTRHKPSVPDRTSKHMLFFAR